MKFSLCLILLGSLCEATLLGTDHIDGPVTTRHAVTDLTDLYAFPSPEQKGRWTLVLNVYPMALQTSHFSSLVEYTFLLREAEVMTDRRGKSTIRTLPASEKTITCRFSTPHDHSAHTSTCDAGNGMKRTVGFNIIDKTADDSGLLYFHGLRSDPFFFNAGWAGKLINKGKLSPPAKSNTMSGVNVLTMVVELDLAKLFGHEVRLVAISAASFTNDVMTKSRRNLDRVGRPEVTNVFLAAHKGQSELRDLYNQEPLFHQSAKHDPAYLQRMVKNIGFYDMADKSRQWQDSDKQACAEMILEDYLVINASKNQHDSSQTRYFGIETELLKNNLQQGIGGRSLSDDVMDIIYTLVVNRDNGTKISDGCNQPSRASSRKFPYLAPPDTSKLGWLKTKIGRLATGSR